MRMLFSGFVIISTTLLLVGCGSGTGGKTQNPQSDQVNEQPTAPPDPVTLKFKPSYTMSAEQVETYITKPLKEKYPHITLEIVKFASGQSWEDVVAADSVPDLIGSPFVDLGTFTSLRIIEDLNPYIKESKLDIGKFEEQSLAGIKNFGKNGELYGIPYEMHYGALFYNKDIFDMFNVPYPTDGMNWDQTIDIAKKLTRKEGSTSFIGLETQWPYNFQYGISMGIGDKADLNNDNWKKILQTMQRNYEIPGFVQGTTFTYGLSAFAKERNLAMYSGWDSDVFNTLIQMYNSGNALNWDMVTQPTLPEFTGTGRSADPHALYISAKSKHKQDAFKVIQVLTSPEVQSMMNRDGILTVTSKTDKEKAEFGVNLPVLQGKNTAAIFKMKPAPQGYHKYTSIIAQRLRLAAQAVALNQKDVNTALRDAQEEATKLIDQELAK